MGTWLAINFFFGTLAEGNSREKVGKVSFRRHQVGSFQKLHSMGEFRGAIEGKTGMTAVIPGCCKMKWGVL